MPILVCIDIVYYIHLLEIYLNWHHWLTHTRRISKKRCGTECCLSDGGHRGKGGYFAGKYPSCHHPRHTQRIKFIYRKKSCESRTNFRSKVKLFLLLLLFIVFIAAHICYTFRVVYLFAEKKKIEARSFVAFDKYRAHGKTCSLWKVGERRQGCRRWQWWWGRWIDKHMLLRTLFRVKRFDSNRTENKWLKNKLSGMLRIP